MWLILAFVSATFLGFYDASKKAALKNNAVLPVLFLNTVFSTLIFSPFLIDYVGGFGWFSGTFLDTAPSYDTVTAHILVFLKACIVLTSWICGYFGLKHIPLTIVGPINATRPVMVLVGAMLIFGERLNLYQWAGVLLTIVSIFLMSRSSKKENIDFRRNKWIWFVAAAAVTGAISGLYDKYVMRMLCPIFTQSWFNFYQMLIMTVICAIFWYPTRRKTTPFRWNWAIPLISIFICIGDFAYLTSLNDSSSMISVVSLVRRSSVIISFALGVLIFKERNLRAKIVDLGLILIGMILIWIGTN
jgi:transporter family protein